MFEENVKKLEELIKSERKIKEAIREEYLDYYKSKYPGEIEYLERRLGGKIESVEPLQYVYDATYCNVVCVDLKDEIKRYAINWSELWDADLPIVDFIYDTEDKYTDVFIILEKLYNEFPFIETEYLN